MPKNQDFPFKSPVEAMDFAARLKDKGITCEVVDSDLAAVTRDMFNWRVRIHGEFDEKVIEEIEAEMQETMLFARADGSIPCKSCGYDLRGQHGDGACPECSHPYRAPAPTTACPRCGESVPGTFDACWSCEQDVGACPKCEASLPRPIGDSCPACKCRFPTTEPNH